MISEARKHEILATKTERQQLELRTHWALMELSQYFGSHNSDLMYQVNGLMRQLDVLRTMEE